VKYLIPDPGRAERGGKKRENGDLAKSDPRGRRKKKGGGKRRNRFLAGKGTKFFVRAKRDQG